ncbi:MAG TPA: M56 family metallopeptidase [Sedimentisphaerales bacterium]|nr:M56 family metallopeptidase [Sedimentisphaerales bacterium]
MEPFIALLESERCTNLLLALAHTLWQGALAAGVLYLYLRRTPAEAVGKRYAAGIAALGVIVLGALLTWSILGYEPAAAQDGVAPTQVVADAPQAPEPTASKIGTPAREIRTIPHPLRSRQIWIMGAWLMGVGVMFLRMVAVVVGGTRLRGQCRPLENVETLALVEQLRAGMGIGRKVRVLVGERISTPGVIGCFWPALLLPASMLSGIPADDLRAILVHELAHIRRYDYLINFLQMVVEALLFFNPAVWWISRQIRIEREACCDAAGVQWIGQRDKYAEALVAWAHRLGTPAPAVGFGRDTDRGTLLDRVRRILIAGHQPRPRVPWHIATAMLVLSLACLILIGQATGLAVNLAGHILSPQERIDAIADISKEYGRDNRQYGQQDSIQVSGVVRTYDGGPLPERVNLGFSSGHHHYFTSMIASMSKGGVFDQKVQYGRIHVMASAKGYAPALAGPFHPEPSGRVDGIELVLGKGFSARIQVVDETGRPIRDARLTGGYTYPDSPSFSNTIELITDTDGIATLEHAAAEKITLQIRADDFEPHQAQELVLDSNEIRAVVLRRAQPVTGVVLDEATGRPIEGAEIRILVAVQGNQSRHENHINSPAHAVTNAQGLFALRQLRGEDKHLLFIRAAGYGYRYIPDVEATSRELAVTLGPRETIRGRVTGDLSLLATDLESGKPIIGVENSYRYPDTSGYSDASGKSPVTIRDGVGTFEIDDFWGQTVTLSAGTEEIRLDVERDPLDDVVIDLKADAQRQVVLRFQVPQGAPPMEGSVRADFITERAWQQRQSMTPSWLDITDNQASCKIPVPGQFRYQIDFHQGKRPVGYWFNGILPIQVEPGETPLVIDVPVHPAGAIYGRVFRPDGSLAEDAGASLITVEKPNIEGRQPGFLSDLSGTLNNAVNRGTFNATPLPLGGRYAIGTHEGYAFAVSETFSLNEKNPIVNVDLMLPRGVDVAGRLLNANGVPARNEVALEVSIKTGQHSWGFSGVQTQPDETGRFIFKNVNPSSEGRCFVRVMASAGYRPVRQEIEDLRSPVVIQLEKGLKITGTVIDDATGRPVPDAEVYALSVDGPQGEYRRDSEFLNAEGRTDTQGRFTFSNMAADYYRLNIRSVNLANPRQPGMALP